MEKPYERLRHARQAAGFKSASAAARQFGWNEAAYRHHENGTRGYNVEQAVIYGDAFKVAPSWLLDLGLGKSDSWRIPLGKLYAEALLPRMTWKDDGVEAANAACETFGLFLLPELSVTANSVDAVEDETGFPRFHFVHPETVAVPRQKFERGFMFMMRCPPSLAKAVAEEGDMLLVDSEMGEIKAQPQLWVVRNFDEILVCWAKRLGDGQSIALPDSLDGKAMPLDKDANLVGLVEWVGRSIK